VKREAKKMISQRPLRRSRAVERFGLRKAGAARLSGSVLGNCRGRV
jgi:hypothetical protein